MIEHIRSMFEHEMVDGNEPLVIDGSIYLTDDPKHGIVWTEEDGQRRLVQVSESEDEWIERMIDQDFPED